MRSILKTPYYFQWLILFFVLHAYTEFVNYIKLSSLLWLVVQLSLAAWLLFFVFRKFYGDGYKSALLTTVVMGSFLFFGALQDFFFSKPGVIFLSYFWVLIPVLGLICLAAGMGLYFYKRPVTKLTRLLNVLLLVYVVYDVMVIVARVDRHRRHVVTAPLQPYTGAKPDVYFILLDEYLGSAGLQEYFHYDNTAFETALTQKGFHVSKNSISNYSSTLYSMASLLNMRYLDSTDRGSTEGEDFGKMLTMIDNNAVCNTFKKLGYTIRNLSPFVVAGQKRAVNLGILPSGIELITDRFVHKRVINRLALGDPPAGKSAMGVLAKWVYTDIEEGHRQLMEEALAEAGKKGPGFTYLHLLMPHKPYRYDSTGRPAGAYNAGLKFARTEQLYLQYLVYTNRRVLEYVGQLMTATAGKAVIVLMSDHGYRRFGYAAEQNDIRFKTLNAVYIPSGNYGLWYDGVSNVNQFRLVMNSVFRQQWPLLKDSTGF